MNNIVNETFKLNSREFDIFKTIIKKCSLYCNDAEIVDGKLRQRTSNSIAIIECDLSSIFRFRRSFVLNDLIDISKHMNVFGKGADVTFTDYKNYFSISNGTLVLNIESSEDNYSHNVFVSDEELKSIVRHDELILEGYLNKKTCELICKTTKAKNVNAIEIKLNKQNVVFTISSPHKIGLTNTINFPYEIYRNIAPSKISISDIPFSFISDERGVLKIYKAKDEKISINTFCFPIKTNIAFEIITRSAIEPLEEKENSIT